VYENINSNNIAAVFRAQDWMLYVPRLSNKIRFDIRVEAKKNKRTLKTYNFVYFSRRIPWVNREISILLLLYDLRDDVKHVPLFVKYVPIYMYVYIQSCENNISFTGHSHKNHGNKMNSSDRFYRFSRKSVSRKRSTIQNNRTRTDPHRHY